MFHARILMPASSGSTFVDSKSGRWMQRDTGVVDSTLTEIGQVKVIAWFPMHGMADPNRFQFNGHPLVGDGWIAGASGASEASIQVLDRRHQVWIKHVNFDAGCSQRQLPISAYAVVGIEHSNHDA